MGDKYTILAVCGKSGAGKDTIVNKYLEYWPERFNKIIHWTTRPPRDYEVEGINYHFTQPFAMNEGVLEWTKFNDWFFGTDISALVKDKINIGVFSPAAIKKLDKNPNINLILVYITCDDKVRLQRCLNREESPNCTEICRRFLTDEQDFQQLAFVYELSITDINILSNWLSMPTKEELYKIISDNELD